MVHDMGSLSLVFSCQNRVHRDKTETVFSKYPEEYASFTAAI